jgi:hypothetical protein
MELFEDDQARESKDGGEKSESRTSTPSRHMTSRSRKAGKMPKKRHVGRTRTSRARHAKKRVPAPAVPSQGTSQPPTPVRPEPPPIIPQPTLDSPEDEPSEPEEPRQEPPPPSASANSRDGDDLFEYVF